MVSPFHPCGGCGVRAGIFFPSFSSYLFFSFFFLPPGTLECKENEIISNASNAGLTVRSSAVHSRSPDVSISTHVVDTPPLTP